MSCRLFLAAPALLNLALLTFTGCSRKAETRPFHRIAVVPFENLSTLGSLDWISPLAPGVISTQTIGAARLLVLPAAGEFDISRVRATQALRGYYQVEGDRLRIRATLYDVARNQAVRRFDHSGRMADGPLPLLDALSTSLAGNARSYPHSSRDAVADFGTALLSGDALKRAELAEAAWRKDPVLASAALEAAQLRFTLGDGPAASKILQAVVSGSHTAEQSQASLLLALLQRNPETIKAALEQAVKHSPRDTDLMRELGELNARLKRFAEAETWFRKALDLEPGFSALWNMLAYTQAYAGNFQPALGSVERLRQLAPQDPNSFDSVAEINWMAGRFDQAYKSFLEAQEKDPLFQGGLEFAKSAFARLMAGDVGKADQLFTRYLESRKAAADPIIELRHAHWLYLSGRRPQALAATAKIVLAGGELGSRAASFQAVWLAQENRKPEAQAVAATAARLARSPGAVNMAAIAGLLASPPAAPDVWQRRAATLFRRQAPAAMPMAALGYALFLDGHYKQSAAVFDQLAKETSPAALDEVQSLLAGAVLLSGDHGRALQLMIRWPLPPQPGESLFASLWFPQIIEWRAKATEKSKGAAAAGALFALYNAITGK